MNKNNELYHHGILGQKWGVRRFQNKDGSLTNAGRLRYSKPVDINEMDRKQFLELVDSGKDFVARKGTLLYRSTTDNDEVLIGKKYVSARKDDIGIYNHMVSELAGPDSTVFDTVYESDKKLSVAGTKVQAKILQEMYGKNLGTNEKINCYVENGWINPEEMSKPIEQMSSKELNSYLYYNLFDHDFDILNKPIENQDTKRYIETLRQKGYDAVIDMCDRCIGYSDGAMVILRAEDSIKRKK